MIISTFYCVIVVMWVKNTPQYVAYNMNNNNKSLVLQFLIVIFYIIKIISLDRKNQFPKAHKVTFEM